MKAFMLGLVLALVSLSTIAMADELPNWELGGSADAYFSYAGFGDGTSSPEFHIGAHGYRFLSSHWELGTYFFYTYTLPSTTNSTTSFRLVPLVTYNFSETPVSSFFAHAGPGLWFFNSSANHSYMTLGFEVAFGKRFPITSSVAWTPELKFSGHTQGTDGGSTWYSATYYEIYPLMISVLF